MTLFAVALTVAAGSAFSIDADTAALYDFKDGDDGAAASGTPVKNLVDASRFPGSTVTFGTAGGGLTFSAERPGKYVYEGEAAEKPIITDPQSLMFVAVYDDAFKKNFGARLAFDDLGSYLATNDHYTIEFFWKYEHLESISGHYLCDVVTGDNLLTNSFRLGFYCKDQDGASIRYHGYAANAWASTPKRNYGPLADNPLYDGLWHHVAAYHNPSTHKITVYYDYNFSATESNNPVTNGTPTVSSIPLILGGTRQNWNTDSSFHGKIACLRVTKRKLAVSEFLYAHDSPDGGRPPLPETAFHWRFEEGATVGSDITEDVLVNSAPSAAPMADKWAPLSYYFHDMNGGKGYYVDWPAGSGVNSGTDYNKWPAYRADVKRPFVLSGQTVLGENARSGYIQPYVSGTGTNEHQKSYGFTTAPYFIQRGPNGASVTVKGDFTMECFAKLDYQLYKDSCQYADTDVRSSRVTRICLMSHFQSGLDSSTQWALIANPWAANDYELYLAVTIPKEDGSGTALTSYYPTTKLSKFTTDYLAKGVNQKWHHYAVAYTAATDTYRVYFDYKLFMETTPARHTSVSTKADFAGAYQLSAGGNACSWSGWIDEVRLSRRALDPSEFLRESSLGTSILIR